MLVVLGAFATEAGAIPAFARKYGFSCTTCHAPAPRLKAYGEEFAGNGFQLPEGEEPRRAFRETGDDMLLLQSDLPLAVRFDAFATFELRDERDDVFDFKTPWGMKLLSGGNVADDVAYYFYFYIAEHGEIAGIEDAYLHFDDLGGQPLDLMVGQFQLCDPMMKRELRLTFEDYQVYRVRPGDSIANLTYDRGIMVTYDTPFGVSLVGEVVNGNGLVEVEADENFDSDPDKGYLLRGGYDIGPVTVGAFGYVSTEILTDGSGAFENQALMYGPDVHVEWDRFASSVQYVHRTDDDLGPALGEVDTDGVVAEAILRPSGPDGKDHLVLLYNWIDSDDDAVDYETWTLSWSHLHARNLRMIAEVNHDVELELTRFVVGFTAAY